MRCTNTNRIGWSLSYKGVKIQRPDTREYIVQERWLLDQKMQSPQIVKGATIVQCVMLVGILDKDVYCCRRYVIHEDNKCWISDTV